MTIPTILRALRPTALQVLCAVGIFHGLSTFVYAIRQRRSRLTCSEVPVIKKPISNRDPIAQRSTRPRVSNITVVQLSPEMRKTKVSDMTQQQKIAAALLKSGASNPIAWNDGGLDDADAASVQVMTAPAATSDEEGDKDTYTHTEATGQPRWKTNLMLWVGAALTTLSLYFFLRSL